MTNNWDLSLNLKIEADEEQALADMLEEIANRIRNLESSGEGNYCTGVYQFNLDVFDLAGVDDIDRTGPK